MKQRIISALIALTICIPLIIVGGIWFDIGLSIIGCLGVNEFISLNKNKISNFNKIICYISIILLIMYNRINFLSFESAISLSLLLICIPLIFYDKKDYNFQDSLYSIVSVIFLGFVFHMMREIRHEDIYVFIYLFLITILTDIFAYFCGRSFGKHKLIERVSPNKTIEGSVCGSLISTIISSIFYIFEVNPAVNIFFIIFITFILTIIGQLGDLFFSSIKRYYGIKDFSNIMPGHGGVLDRLDSVIFVILGYMIFIGLL